MLVATAIEKMIDFYKGNRHDINHFLKVWSFAKTIGEKEGLDEDTQKILELTAVVHDIACPLCREKYGNANGKMQEKESAPLVDAFFAELPVEKQKVERIRWLVEHHHTYTDVKSADHQILLEADFLVNFFEDHSERKAVETAVSMIFRTSAGRRVCQKMFLEEPDE